MNSHKVTQRLIIVVSNILLMGGLLLIQACESPETLTPTDVHGSTYIYLDLDKSSEVIIVVENRFDTIVRHMDFGVLEEGRQELFWDGLDDNGASLLPGLYFVRAGIDGEAYSYTIKTYRVGV